LADCPDQQPGDTLRLVRRRQIGGNRGMPKPPTEFPPVPETLHWDLWLGPAAERPYSPAYAPYNWRFWWDFGTGETGNWGCHILDIPFWALDLKYPTKVTASGPEADSQRTPKSMTVQYDFPAAEKRPALKLHWYHGTPPILKALGIKGGGNNLFIGSEGMLLCEFGQPKLLPEEKFSDYKQPESFLPKTPGHHREWIRACKGGEAAACNFNYSGPLSETVLLGNVAYRAGGGFEWDAEKLTASGNEQAPKYLRSHFRAGWEV